MRLAIGLLAFLASPTLATTPLGGGVSFGVEVGIEAAKNQNFDGYAWADVPELASVGLDAFVGFAPASVYGFAGGDAIWKSSDAGVMDFDHGWVVNSDGAFSYDGYVALDGSPDPDWFYSFVAESDGFFRLSYEIETFGNPVGLQGWLFDWGGGNVYIGDVLDPAGAGSKGFQLTAGEPYTVSLKNYAGLTFANGIPSISGTMASNFAWEIISRPAVPEAETWVMMIAGFGLVGSAVRRRQAASE